MPKDIKLTDKEVARIARALAEPRRYQVLKEIGAAKGGTIACSDLRAHHKVTAATLSPARAREHAESE